MSDAGSEGRGVGKWVLWGCGGCAVLAVLGAIAIAVIGGGVAFSALKNAEPYQEGVRLARADAEVVAALGEPIREGLFVMGQVSVNGPTGQASLSVPLHGPKGRGTLYIEAEKSAGRWRFTTLEVEVRGRRDRIDLLERGTPVSTRIAVAG